MFKEFKSNMEPLGQVWAMKLFTIAGVKISLGNLLIALTLLLFAARLSRLSARIINNRLILKVVDDKAAQNTYQTFVSTDA